MEPRDVITAIAGKTGDIGAIYYFHPDTLARGKELDLDGLRFYLLGRGGVLGNVEPDVVIAAFGYLAPAMVEKLWTTGTERIAPRQAAREHLACNARLGRKLLADVDGLEAYSHAAAAVVAAVDVSGLSLFAGVRAEPVPDDSPARAMHHGVLLRELRGSAHLVAVRSTGLTTAVAHAIKRPDDMAMFGWSEAPVVTDADRERMARAEVITDEILVSAFSVLDDAAAAALVAGTDAIHAVIRGHAAISG